jgi:hypothetical protein
MARYIDANKITADFVQSYTANADTYLTLRKILNDVPTADVAPKSEVAKIFAEIRKSASYCVASHNGEELYHTKQYSISAMKLDEIENKYTEGTNEN